MCPKYSFEDVKSQWSCIEVLIQKNYKVIIINEQNYTSKITIIRLLN